MKITVPEYILAIKPYKAGKPLEELEREYGITDSIKIASNENPLGPSPLAVQAIRDAVTGLHRYPDSNGYELIGRISAKLGVPRTSIVLGNGSDDLIGMLTRALLESGDEALLPQPSFLMYEIMTRSCGARPVFVPLRGLAIDLDAMRTRVTPRTRMIFICNPNNPTGTVIAGRELAEFLKTIPEGVVVVLDEAYFEFVRDTACVSGIEQLANGQAVVTLKTFSKAYGLAGLRVGYGVMPAEIAELLNRIRQPFNVNSLALAGAAAALNDNGFLARTRQTIHEGLEFLYNALTGLGIAHYPTHANFFLIDVKRDADVVFENMLRQGVIVRSMSAYGYPNYIRVNVGLASENDRLIKALEKVLS